VTPIALRWGWRTAFLMTGVLGAAWLGLWAAVSPDARLVRARARTKRQADAGDAAAPRLLDPSVQGFMLAYAFGGLPLGFVMYAAPIHLARGLGCSQATLGHVLWLPPLGWEVGYFFWGWVVDRAAARGRVGPAFFRRVFPWLAVLGAPLAAAGFTRTLAIALPLLFLGMFVSAGFVIVSLAEVTHRHTTRHSAYLAGLGAGAWAGLMMVAMPVFGGLLDRRAYPVAYALAAASFGMAWLAWSLAARRVDRVSEAGAPLPRSSA
jgi:MFS transporter, ACS family, hexuronate transporter